MAEILSGTERQGHGGAGPHHARRLCRRVGAGVSGQGSCHRARAASCTSRGAEARRRANQRSLASSAAHGSSTPPVTSETGNRSKRPTPRLPRAWRMCLRHFNRIMGRARHIIAGVAFSFIACRGCRRTRTRAQADHVALHVQRRCVPDPARSMCALPRSRGRGADVADDVRGHGAMGRIDSRRAARGTHAAVER